MKVAVFDTRRFERTIFEAANKTHHHELHFFKESLVLDTTPMAKAFPCVCSSVYSDLGEATLKALREGETRLVALRSTGYNNVDLVAAKREQLTIARVPNYSPYSVAEHAAGLVLTLNRKLHRAYIRVRELDFSLDGLVGFDLNGKTVGVIGTGRIGSAFANIMHGFGCRLLAYDNLPNSDLIRQTDIHYVDRSELFRDSDILSLHCPLTSQTQHLLNQQAFEIMKKGVYIINTSRGGLIDTAALIAALKDGIVGGAGLDVYEEEEGIFSTNLSSGILKDDVLARLLTFPNVIVTAHQAFLTNEAISQIAETTLHNITEFERGERLENEIRAW